MHDSTVMAAPSVYEASLIVRPTSLSDPLENFMNVRSWGDGEYLLRVTSYILPVAW